MKNRFCLYCTKFLSHDLISWSKTFGGFRMDSVWKVYCNAKDEWRKLFLDILPIWDTKGLESITINKAMRLNKHQFDGEMERCHLHIPFSKSLSWFHSMVSGQLNYSESRIMCYFGAKSFFVHINRNDKVIRWILFSNI